MNLQVYIRTRALILDALTLNREHTSGIPASLASVSATSKFVRDFLTVTIGLGQRTGKTSAMYDLAEEGHAIVALSPERAASAKAALRDKSKESVAVFTRGQIVGALVDGQASQRYSVIWVDDYGLFPTEVQAQIAEYFYHDKEQVFVHLR